MQTDPAPSSGSEAPKPEHHPDLSIDSPKQTREKYKRMRAIAIAAGAVAALLLILVVVFATKANINSKTIDAAIAKGEAAGKSAQKDEDNKNFNDQQNKDTRVYTAPDAYGAFQLSLPKYYSLMVTPASNGALTGMADPDVVDTKAQHQAFRIEIRTSPTDQVKKNYDSLAQDKRNGISTQEVTVSGIKGTKYTGVIDKTNNNTTAGTVVLLPVRDKTYILQTDDNDKYGTVYQQILDQIKINP